MGLIVSNSTDDSSVPDATPPVGGKEVANIDVNAPGRTADKLTHWASDLAEATDIPPQARRARPAGVIADHPADSATC